MLLHHAQLGPLRAALPSAMMLLWLAHWAQQAQEQSDKVLCDVQNPVNSYAWVVAKIQIFAPVAALDPDTRHFLQSMYSSRVFVTLVVIVSLVTNGDLLLGPLNEQHFNFFRLVRFPLSFNLQAYGVALTHVIGYMIPAGVARRIISCYSCKRVTPVSVGLSRYQTLPHQDAVIAACHITQCCTDKCTHACNWSCHATVFKPLLGPA